MSYYPEHASISLKTATKRLRKPQRKQPKMFALGVHPDWSGWIQHCTFCRRAGARKYHCSDGNNWFLCAICSKKTEAQMEEDNP